jgi:hypothetical protein
MTAIRKGYCEGCPFDFGKPATETAYNLGCLPGTGEVNAMCAENGTAWACHNEPDKVCCGHAARRELPLQRVAGVPYSEGQEPPDDWTCAECGYSYPADCVTCDGEGP